MVMFFVAIGFGQCGINTPTFNVDLTNSANATWSSPPVVRADTCCGSASNDKCLKFVVTLNPLAEGIIFDICDGAIPPGALYYQVGCGPIAAVGEALCLSGPGPHIITFCKPGNNTNIYCITSIAEPAPGPAANINDGCSGFIYVQGYDPDSVQWTSIYPGAAGAYDSYLDCTFGCDTVHINGQPSAPDTVLYQVCGPLLGDCDTLSYCDTIAVYFHSTLGANINPIEPTVCFGASGTYLYAGGVGGSPPYNFSWSTGDTLDSIFVNVGTYYLTVGDISGCPPAFDTITVTSFSVPIEALAGNDTTICESAIPFALNATVLAASGGHWFGGAGTFAPNSNTLSASYNPTLSELTAGFVELFLETTGNGSCPADTDTLVLSFHSFDTQFTLSTTDASCYGLNDGQAFINVTGGTAISSITWSTMPAQNGSAVSGLAAGNYNVTVVDIFGCDSVIAFVLDQPDSLVINLDSLHHVSCFGLQNGAAFTTAQGGTTPYSFAWSTGSSNDDIFGVASGIYSVTLSDQNGCSDTISVSISQPDSIAFVVTETDASCFGSQDGAITMVVSGGSPNYIYNWNSGQTTASISSLFAGNYTLYVTDSQGCQDSISAQISEPDSIQISLNSTDVSCFGFANGAIGASVFGGTMPYSYVWSTGATNDSISALAAGSYSLTVSDANGCVKATDTAIIEPSPLALSATLQPVSCFGLSNGYIQASPSGGTQPYLYNWSNGVTLDSNHSLPFGFYNLTVTDANGCSVDSAFFLFQPAVLVASTTKTDLTCNGDFSGAAVVNPTGGTLPYFYNWSNNATSQSISGLAAGTYSVTVTDSNGCAFNTSVNITQPTAVQLTTSPNMTICKFDSSHVASATASGGNGNYQYNFGTGFSSINSIFVNAEIDSFYVFQAMDYKGCLSPFDTVYVSIFPIVFGEIGLTANPKEYCQGEQTSLSATYSGSTSGYSFGWSHGLGSGLGPKNLQLFQTDWVTFTVTDHCGFKASDSIQIIVNPLPVINLPETLSIGCAQHRATFNAGLSNISSYSWTFGNGQSSTLANPSVLYQFPGTYQVSLSVVSDKGCLSVGQNKGLVIVRPAPVAALSVSPKVVDTDNPVVSGVSSSEGAIDFLWLISDGNEYSGETFTHTFSDWGKFQIALAVENQFGCVDTARDEVEVKPVLRFNAPNAFTPSDALNDGYYDPAALNNDIFYLKTTYVKKFHLTIHNRWGEVVFETFDPAQGWNGFYKGELAPMAMYVWRADIEYVTGLKTIETGDVTLLR